MLAEDVPFAATDAVPVMLEFEVLISWLNTTVPPVIEIGLVIESVLVSAFNEARVQVEIPEASVALQVP